MPPHHGHARAQNWHSERHQPGRRVTKCGQRGAHALSGAAARQGRSLRDKGAINSGRKTAPVRRSTCAGCQRNRAGAGLGTGSDPTPADRRGAAAAGRTRRGGQLSGHHSSDDAQGARESDADGAPQMGMSPRSAAGVWETSAVPACVDVHFVCRPIAWDDKFGPCSAMPGRPRGDKSASSRRLDVSVRAPLPASVGCERQSSGQVRCLRCQRSRVQWEGPYRPLVAS